ncbi:EAL domain-containing protein [Citrobacter freundii]|nr:EAL domain-containing protein [Citrobacter freundii]
MSFIPSRIPLPPVTPLRVPVFDREWVLAPWSEPVWSGDGRLVALDMRSRPADSETGTTALPAWFFTRLSPREQFRVLCWQLGILAQMSPWCASRDVCVSLSITPAVAMCVLAEPSVQEEILGLAPYVRFEISGRFLAKGKTVPGAPFLQGLLALAPLWLGDFGVDRSGLSWLMSGLFDAVKTDRHFLSELHAHPGGESFLAALGVLGERSRTQIIATGVSDPELMAFARRGQVTACHGTLWPAVPAEHLHMLANRCPGAECSVFPAAGEHDA